MGGGGGGGRRGRFGFSTCNHVRGAARRLLLDEKYILSLGTLSLSLYLSIYIYIYDIYIYTGPVENSLDILYTIFSVTNHPNQPNRAMQQKYNFIICVSASVLSSVSGRI